MLPRRIRAVLDALPEDALVLDVGGWAEVDPRADWVIDIGPFETRNWYRTLGQEIGATERVTRDHWVQRDFCSSEPWPFADDMFDYVICSQTLEDVRDPIRVCEEIARVGKRGYIATPGAAIELTRGIDSPHWCGWMHHRWLVERDGETLNFVAKPSHIHSPLWPAIRSPRLLLPEAREPLELDWEGTLGAEELILVERDEVDAHLLGIIARSSRRDPIGAALRKSRTLASKAHRSARRATGSMLGR